MFSNLKMGRTSRPWWRRLACVTWVQRDWEAEVVTSRRVALTLISPLLTSWVIYKGPWHRIKLSSCHQITPLHVLDIIQILKRRKSYPGGRGSLLTGEHYRFFFKYVFFLFEADLIVGGVVGGSVGSLLLFFVFFSSIDQIFSFSVSFFFRIF